MKTMKIDKMLLFDDKIIAITDLKASEKLTYQEESDGNIRAIGPLFIDGEMINEEGKKQPFHEVLDMDVLAPAYKLNSTPFHLNIDHVDYQLQEDGVSLSIGLQIEGLKEIEADEKIEVIQEDPPKSEEVIEQVEETSENVYDDLEDIFDGEETTFTNYRMVVALANDSYERIAKRYEVDEDTLKEVNHNKEVLPKSLIVLPF